MHKRVLYQTDFEITLFELHQQQLQEITRFRYNSPEEHHRFNEFLQQDNDNPIAWLIDSGLEEYQSMLQPHVVGQDRKNLIEMRRRRLYDNNNFVYASIQGREAHGRGDDRVLFTALQQANQLLSPWIELLTEAKIPLTGIYSLPLLTQSLLKFLPKNYNTLLVAHTPALDEDIPQGLRQSFFQNQQLHFSRLTPLSNISEQDYAEQVITQISRTERYLSSNRLINVPLQPHLNVPTQLTVFFITASPYYEYIENYLNQNPKQLNFNIELIDIYEMADYLKIALLPHREAINETPLYLHHFIVHSLFKTIPPNHYAQNDSRRYFWYRRLKKIISISTWLIVSSSLSLSSIQFYQAWQEREQALIIKNQIDALNADLTIWSKEKIDLPTDNLDVIQTILNTGKMLSSRQHYPAEIIISFSHILSDIRYNDFQITDLEWKLDNLLQPTEKKNGTEAYTANSANEQLHVKGQVYLLPLAYIPTLRRFNNFVEDLKKQLSNEWQVEILIEPRREGAGVANFELLLTNML